MTSLYSDNYFESDGINRSRLALIGRSPEYFKYCEDNPQQPSHDLIVGKAFHKLVLEPDGFEDEFAVCPAIDRRTKDGKSIYQEMLYKSEGKDLLMWEDFTMITAMRDKVLEYKITPVLLRGEIEKPFYWTDKLTGELCKVKPDVLADVGNERVIVDLKSCRCAETETFMRDALRFGYDLQAGMYKEGVDICTKQKHRFVFVAVEKTPPYSVNVMEADDFFIDHGQHLFRKYLDIYHECKTTGNWYGYNGKDGYINNLSVPSWLVSDIG